jgi:hypothetical protein
LHTLQAVFESPLIPISWIICEFHCVPYKPVQNQVIFKLSGRSPRQDLSSRVMWPRCRCLNLGSSLHVFELESKWTFPLLDILAWGLFITGYFKGCDWPLFCEWQGQQIWQLLIPRVKEA